MFLQDISSVAGPSSHTTIYVDTRKVVQHSRQRHAVLCVVFIATAQVGLAVPTKTKKPSRLLAIKTKLLEKRHVLTVYHRDKAFSHALNL